MRDYGFFEGLKTMGQGSENIENQSWFENILPSQSAEYVSTDTKLHFLSKRSILSHPLNSQGS